MKTIIQIILLAVIVAVVTVNVLPNKAEPVKETKQKPITKQEMIYSKPVKRINNNESKPVSVLDHLLIKE